MNKKKENISHSDKYKNMLMSKPHWIIRFGNIILLIIVITLFIAISFIDIPHIGKPISLIINRLY